MFQAIRKETWCDIEVEDKMNGRFGAQAVEVSDGEG